MSISGQNVNNIKYSNRSLLLNLLYFGGAQSRKALAKKSGLTAAAITMIMNELIEDKAVVETDKLTASGRLGRNEQLLDLNYKELFVVGVRLGIDEFDISLTRLDNKVIAIEQFSLSLIKGDLFKTGLENLINGLIGKFSIPIRFVVGVGITVKGIVDTIKGVSLNSYGILENNFKIASPLSDDLKIPVIVENNVRSMLRADIILRHAQSAQSTLFIKYGPGVGGALFIGQESFLGSNCDAIELGHICVEPEGKQCICGKTGCLETTISFESIVEQVKNMLSKDNMPFLYDLCKADEDKVTIEKIMLAFENEDCGVVSIINKVIKYLSLSVANCSLLLDPEVVLLTSEAFSGKRFLSSFQQALIGFSGHHKPRYLISADSKKLEAGGPASIAINNFLSTGGLCLRAKIVNEKESAI